MGRMSSFLRMEKERKPTLQKMKIAGVRAVFVSTMGLQHQCTSVRILAGRNSSPTRTREKADQLSQGL